MARVFSLLCMLMLLAAVPARGIAQPLMFLDESGNIHFVDNLAEVPERYKDQLVTPTPGPKTMKEYKKLTKAIEKTRKEKLKVAQKKKKLAVQKKKKITRELEKEKKKLKAKEEKEAKLQAKKLNKKTPSIKP